jgi:hypothetical protein
MKAGLLLGAVFLMISSRWAVAAETAPTAVPASAVEGSTPGVQRSPGPSETDLLAIKGATFYEVVGRPDLAAVYRSRHRWAVASRVVGGVALGLGALVHAAAQAFSDPLCDQSSCNQNRTLWVPDIMMVGGAALLVLPVLWSNDPVNDEQKEQLARDAAARWGGLSMAAAPAGDGRGGTFVIGGTF